jgi:hypothetical protein
MDRPIYGTAGNVGGGSPPPESPAYLEWLRLNANNLGGGDAGGNNYQAPPAEIQAEIDRQNTLKPIVVNGQEVFQLGPAADGGENPYDDRHVEGAQPFYDPTYGWVAPSSSFNQRDSMGQDLLQTLAQTGIAAAYGGAALQGAGLLGSGAEFGGIETGLSGTMNTGGNAFLADAAASAGAAGAGMSPEGFYGTEAGFSGAEAPAVFDPVPGQMDLLAQPELTGSMVSDPLANPSLWDTLKPYLKPAASLASNFLGGQKAPGGSSGGLPSGSSTQMGGVATPPGTRTQDAPMGMVNYADIFKGEPEQQGFAPVIQALMKRAKTNGGW